MSVMQQGPLWGSTTIRRHNTKFVHLWCCI